MSGIITLFQQDPWKNNFKDIRVELREFRCCCFMIMCLILAKSKVLNGSHTALKVHKFLNGPVFLCNALYTTVLLFDRKCYNLF